MLRNIDNISARLSKLDHLFTLAVSQTLLEYGPRDAHRVSTYISWSGRVTVLAFIQRRVAHPSSDLIKRRREILCFVHALDTATPT